jgi:glucose-1-phosphate thymidylyltransferase
MTKMKGVVLAGGTGSRLLPLTKVTNKHLLPVGRKPMIFYPIEKFIEVGIRDILIVVGIEHAGAVMGLLGSGKEFRAEFTYRVQDEAGGIAQALYLARGFAGDDPVAVILGDNIFEDSMRPWVENFSAKPDCAQVVTKQVPDPQRFGVIRKGDNGVVAEILEKPKNPPSDLAVTGVYFYPSDVYDIIKTLKPSHRGELEITDVNNFYIRKGRMQYVQMTGNWTDAGTFESLHRANSFFGRSS